MTEAPGTTPPDAEKEAIRQAHAMLFEIDRMLAETYAPARSRLIAMHERIYQARRGLEDYFGCVP